MRAAVLALLLALTLLFTACAQNKEKAAVQVAEHWLAELDAGKYGESWQQAAPVFKAAVSQQQWEQIMKSKREPLGALVSRQLGSAHYKTQIPGAPDGQYVVVQFNTSFEQKKSAVEMVTPMLDKDGQWKVSGYYIK